MVATRRRAGFRPSYPGERPTLGWGVLAHMYEHLRSPRDERVPLELTQEQAQHVLYMYELDPDTGRRRYRRAHEEQAKGWGKSPFAGAIAIEEFVGPVCFDGWDADGQPVGVPWGSGGRPTPWVQVAAVSEDQTQNTWNALYGLLSADGGGVADELHIDDGRTRLYRTDMPQAFMERVTASAGSREGQPITFAVLDEPQLWDESNRGIRLALTILRNLAKMNGWGLFTGNAPILGVGSVAEIFGGWEQADGVWRQASVADDVLYLANRADPEPDPDATVGQLRETLRGVYGGAWWVDLDRLLADICDPASPWADSRRFFFNLPEEVGSGTSWLPDEAWADAATGPVVFTPARPVHVVVQLAGDHRTAAIAMAQRGGDDGVLLSVTPFSAEGAEYVPVARLELYIMALKAKYPASVPQAVARPGRPDMVRSVPGPEVGYSGSFFEGSAQRLRARKMQAVDLGTTAERLAKASDTFKTYVLEGRLSHDAEPELSRQLRVVREKETARGRQLMNAGPAIRAAIHAVHRASIAPVQTPRQAVFRSM